MYFHNEVVERYISRFEKYTVRGITIIGPELEKYKQCGVFRKVDNVHQMSRGVSIFVRPDYYYNVDDSIDERKSYDDEMFLETETEISDELRRHKCYSAQWDAIHWLKSNRRHLVCWRYSDIRSKYFKYLHSKSKS